MRRLLRRKPRQIDPARLLFEIEKRVEREMRRKSISISFWGTLTLHPNEVYVSKEQSDRSLENLRQWLAKERALSLDTPWNGMVPHTGA